MISAIVAVDSNLGIGSNGKLLARIPEDMQRFKDLTEGNAVVMGRKTQESLPKGYLPGRDNYVISKSGLTLTNFLKQMPSIKKDLFIIGGGQIYKQLLPYCDRIYATAIFKEFDNVDVFFPSVSPKEWELSWVGPVKSYGDIDYQFQIIDRIK